MGELDKKFYAAFKHFAEFSKVKVTNCDIVYASLTVE